MFLKPEPPARHPNLWISDTQMWTAGPPPVFATHQAIDRNSPCSIVDPQNPGSPNRGFLHREP
jgi:hypothetical protein